MHKEIYHIEIYEGNALFSEVITRFETSFIAAPNDKLSFQLTSNGK
jgi:hypothetical protein